MLTEVRQIILKVTITVAEVISKLRQKGVPEPEALLASLEIDVDPSFGARQAGACGTLHAETRRQGLSLAGCICLAMAKWNGATAVTAEREWSRVAEGRNIEVLQIR